MNIIFCKECEEWCSYESAKSIGHELYCDECYEELEGDNQCRN